MAAITFDVGRKKAAFSLGTPAAIGIGFHVSVREVGGEPYDGPYTVTPDFETQELATKDRVLKDNVTVDPIAVARVENPSGGKTIYIGGIFNG